MSKLTIHPEQCFPNPKRPTLASQKLQLKKLAKPFRSPILKRPKVDGSESLVQPPQVTPALNHEIKRESNASEMLFSQSPVVDEREKHRTQRAAAQFKSPLVNEISPKLSSVRMTPTIQELERKAQVLKRAIKIKEQGDEETLKRLIGRWTEAGREVAWEVWELVKDNTNSSDQLWGQEKTGRGTFGTGWGWDEKCSDAREKTWGLDEMESSECAMLPEGERNMGVNEDCDEEKGQDTIGTMLLQLGIAPETLGWNEEEGVFQDG